MKIISKYKDYYDHLSYVYGIDDRVVYNRYDLCDTPQNEEEVQTTQVFGEKVENDQRLFMNFGKLRPGRFGYYESTIKYWLCVVGKVYPLVVVEDFPRKKYEILDASRHKKYGEFYRYHTYYQPTRTTSYGKYFKWVEKISQRIRQPVFIMKEPDFKNGSFEVDIDEMYTPLSEIRGFTSRYPTEQLYQDIYHFLSNTINKDPDIMPEGNPAQTDGEKILSHGFDKKISFRHRKNS